MPDFGRWTSNGGDPSLNEINRTDRFLDALAFEQPVYSTDTGEAELADLLSGWRDDVRDAPLQSVVTPRDAVLALDNAQRSRRRTRTLALVGSVAATVLCLGGFVSVVAGAGPGDTLYGLHTMIFGEQQSPRDDAVMLASQQLAEVQQLIDQGQWQAAQDKLQTLTTTVATVNDDEQKQELVTQWQELTVKVESQDASATVPPGEPLPQMPDVPVVVAPGSDTSATSPTGTSSETTTTPTSPTSPTSSETTTTSSATSSATTTTPPSSVTTTTSPPPATTSPPPPRTSPPPSSPAPQLPPVTTTTVRSTVQAVPPSPQIVQPAPPPSTRPSVQAPPPASPVVTPQPTPTAQQQEPAPEEQEQEEAPQEPPRSAVTTTIEESAPDEGPN